MQPNWFVALEVVPTSPLEFPPPAAGIRLLHPADYHITVAFFGSMPTDPTTALEDYLPQLSSEAPLQTIAHCAMLLPRVDWASVIALGFEDAHLHAFIAKWRDQLRTAVGLPPERRPILPHLTVARMKPTRHQQQLQERKRWMETLVQQLPHPFRFTAIGLYTWRERTLPHQPRYRTTLRSVFVE